MIKTMKINSEFFLSFHLLGIDLIFGFFSNGFGAPVAISIADIEDSQEIGMDDSQLSGWKNTQTAANNDDSKSAENKDDNDSKDNDNNANLNCTKGDKMISLEYAPQIVTRSSCGHTTGIRDEKRTMTQLTHGCHKYQPNGC
jgi:hypothetical protein